MPRAPKGKSGRKPTRNYKIEEEIARRFDDLAEANFMSPPMAITMFMGAALKYAEPREGRFPNGIRIVSDLEYAEFERWKEARDKAVQELDQPPSRETA